MIALRWLSPAPGGMYAVVDVREDGRDTVQVLWAPQGGTWGVLSHLPTLGPVSANVAALLDQTAVLAPGGWWR